MPVHRFGKRAGVSAPKSASRTRAKPAGRGSTAVAVVGSLVAALFSVALVSTPAAGAASTTLSDFTKKAVDVTNSSSATVGSPGNAKSGDTVKWVLSYRNMTGSDAALNITDPITGGQTYVPNSLQTPTGLNGTADNTSVNVSGTALSGTTAAQSPNFTANAISLTTSGGDGYSVEGFGDSVYTVFHHNASSTVVFCATLTNQVCAGWPGHSTYVSTTAGTPLGTGPVSSTYSSGYVNGSFISNGRLYWSISQNGADGVNDFGMQCLDLVTRVSCGYAQFGTTTQAGFGLAGDGIAAADGNYYYMDNNGFLECVSPAGTPCGAVDVAGGPIGSGGVDELGTYGRYVFISYDNLARTTNYLACFDTTTHALCPNFPQPAGTFSGNFDSEVLPVVSSTGAVLGACAVYNGVCFDVNGSPLANPWSQQAYAFQGGGPTQGFGTGVLVGTRYYTGNADVDHCYDFSLPLVGGQVQPCAAFTTNPPNLHSYTVRALANLPGCMASNGDGAQISIFNAISGAPCTSASQSLTLTPSSYYCDGQSGHASTWGVVSLPGLAASDYLSATLSLFDKNGQPVSGWQNVAFPSSGPQTIDISTIPVAGATTSLTATVNLAAVIDVNKVQGSALRVTWVGNPIQVCYETVMPQVPCLQATTVSNSANAVTFVDATTNDRPDGNDSGTVTFGVTPTAAQCMLQLDKTASPNPAKPGDTVTYTITVHNAGVADYLATGPATASDDISNVLADSSFDNPSLIASAGTASYDPLTNVISWSGPLAAGATATITYTVSVNTPDTGDHSMFNRVTSTEPSNCGPNTTDPACSVTVPISDLTVSKSANPADGSTVTAGQVVTYTLTFKNTGKAPAPVDYTDDLSKVLDDATVTSAPSASNANLTASAVTGGAFTVTGSVPATTTYTVTYQVTVNPDGQRGDDDMVNFVFPTGTTPPTNCTVGDPTCTEHNIPEIVASKSSNPADGSAVVAGDVLTYTLTFHNIGTGDGTLDYTDDLSGVLDDARITADPSTSNDNITASAVTGNRFTVTGTVPAGATYTVTYNVKVNTVTERGDSQLNNFLFKSGTTPPTSCEPGDPLCTVHFVRHLSITKTASTTTRPAPGDTVSYTVVVTNDGTVAYDAQNPATVTDDLSKVLDDATYNNDAGATSGTTPSLTANQLSWSGALDVGQSVTITYSVTYQGTGDTVMTNTACVPPQGQDTNCASADVPAALMHITKSVDPANGSTVVAGQTLTYTLTFQNTGQGAGDVNYTDDLSKVLDDATLESGPSASNNALAVSPVTGGAFTVTGIVAPTTTYTVTYSVQVKPDGQRGDNSLDNFLVPTGQTPPIECTVDDLTCTHNPIPEIIPTKTVDPASGSTVHAGDVLTYTLTFPNTGTATGSIDYIDYLSDVLDDATVNSAPTPSSTDLTVTSISNGQFEVAGTVPAGSTYTVTYQVTIKPDGKRGNDLANNFAVPKGTQPPSQCVQGDPLCTTNPMPDILGWKTVNPVSGTSVVPGQTLTYTLHFQNVGTVPGDVTKVDDISQLVDDATVTSQPAASDPALSVTTFAADDRATITGTLGVGQTVTITYAVKVSNPDAGDGQLANFLQNPSAPPPTSPKCAPADPTHPDCTNNAVGVLAVTKSVNPANFSQVRPGQVLTYTLKFHNTGAGTAKVAYTDHVGGVLDDAVVAATPTTSDMALSVSAISGGRFRVTGTLAAGQTVRVTYKVKVKPYDQQGDHSLDNFLDPTGTTPPGTCLADNPLCTHNPVPTQHGTSGGGAGSGGGTAFTGGDWRAELILAGLLLGTGALLVLVGRRRRHIV